MKQKDIPCIILEKKKTPGGLCRSIKKDRYIFDYTGHFLHTHSDYVTKFVKKKVPEIKEVDRKSFVYLRKRLIPYPIQTNISYLPLLDMVRAAGGYFFRDRGEPDNLKEWILSHFGSGLAEMFFFPYNKKLWKYPLSEISQDFLKPFVPKIRLSGKRENVGYNVKFLYPEKGIGQLIDALSMQVPIEYNTEIKSIERNKIYCGESKFLYDVLISTIPLPEFLNLLNLREELPVSKGDFVWNSVLSINIGLEGRVNPPFSSVECPEKDKFHWIYFPEEKFPFYRVGSFSNVSSEMVPEGHSSLWVEVSYRDKVYNKDIIESSIEKLSELGFFNQKDIDCVLPLWIDYAYPIHDKYRKERVDKVKEYLSRYNMRLAGRFGEWKYSYMGESIIDAKKIAEEL